MPVQEYKIESMSHGAYAIAHDNEGQVVFIENACPGDVVLAEVYDKRKGFSYAKITEIKSASDLQMQDAPCKVHKVCGSCQWQHIDYAEQLRQKKKNLLDLLTKTGIDYQPEIEIQGMEEPWNYRNKVVYPVRTVEKTSRLQAGYFKRNSNELINIKYCPIQYSIFDEIIAAVKEEASEKKVNSKHLRHILLRSNHDFSEILLSLIVRKNELYGTEGRKRQKNLSSVLHEVKNKFPQIVTTTLNYNDNSTNVILGDETEVHLGKGIIHEKFYGLNLEISTESFFQVNTKQFTKIIDLLKNHIAANKSQAIKILDAYCGAGTISLSLAKAIPGLQIKGIEVVEAAVENAIASAKKNKLDLEFICGKVEDHIHDFQEGDFDYVIVNPPRKGCTKSVIEALGKIASKEILYVSCNPATVTRDIKMLEDYGYKLSFIEAVDMFPHSFHFETVAVIARSPKGDAAIQFNSSLSLN